MKYIILFLFLFQITLQTPYKFVTCPDGETFCFEGYKCCNKVSGYYCCLEKETCSPDGVSCLTYNPFKSRFEQTPAFRGHKSFPDVLLIVDNFLKTIEFYSHIPETINLINDLTPLIPDIVELIKKIKQVKSIEELIPIIMKAFEELYPAIKEVINECRGVRLELKENFREIYKTVTQPGYLQKLIEHAKLNSGQIMIKVIAAGTEFKEKKYAECGTTLGDAFNLIFKF